MPRRDLRCILDIKLNVVSAPGVWLPSREDVYVSVSVFGQYQTTRRLTSIFPLLIHETMSFEKIYYTALAPIDVMHFLEDEVVTIELLQQSSYTAGSVCLASYSARARDFMYPYPSLAPSYRSTDREVLLSRTVAFPGISPKIEFSTRAVVIESVSPVIDAFEDAVELERARSRVRTRARARSASLPRRIADLTIDPRPPFVVRKVEKELISRTPGGGRDSHALSKSKKSYTMNSNGPLCCLCKIHLKRTGFLYPGHTTYYHQRSMFCTVCRRLFRCSICETYIRCYGRRYADHSESYHGTLLECGCGKVGDPLWEPLPSYRVRYDPLPSSSLYYSWLADRAADRARLWPYYGTTLYDLDLATSVARSRRYLPLY